MVDCELPANPDHTCNVAHRQAPALLEVFQDLLLYLVHAPSILGDPRSLGEEQLPGPHVLRPDESVPLQHAQVVRQRPVV